MPHPYKTTGARGLLQKPLQEKQKLDRIGDVARGGLPTSGG
jgi:hypothetical protein